MGHLGETPADLQWMDRMDAADGDDLLLHATKPDGPVGRRLRELGLRVEPFEEPANVDWYVLSPRLAIERRTGSSFLRGIQDKTLFTSAVHLREGYDTALLILEGETDYTYTSFDPRAVRGAASAMVIEYGITVLSAPNAEETAQLIAMMTRHEQTGVPEISFVPKRKAVDLPDLQRRVVEMLPGCGMVMARDLLQHFGSILRIVSATPEELMQVRGIGRQRAEGIARVLTVEYEAVDTERNLEDAIVASPGLLFDRPVELLARQHVLFSEGRDRHAIDLVLVDRAADEVILLELKRGALRREHEAQLRRYLDHASRSALIAPLIDAGARLSGLLATIDPALFQPRDPQIAAVTIDPSRVIAVLRDLRTARLAVSAPPP